MNTHIIGNTVLTTAVKNVKVNDSTSVCLNIALSFVSNAR